MPRDTQHSSIRMVNVLSTCIHPVGICTPLWNVWLCKDLAVDYGERSFLL